jgi:REP element-mobilizing transposase RayT
MTLFQNKYRIESTRLKTWNYAANSAYFVTICTKDRVHFFGRVVDGEMQLNELGAIVQQEWLKTPAIRQDMNLLLDEFVVMPNHFHGILLIGNNIYNTMPAQTAGLKSGFGPQLKNLSSIIRGLKATVTKEGRKVNPGFGWQERFHDHIIRSHDSYLRIRNYVINNPVNWQTDKFYSE